MSYFYEIFRRVYRLPGLARDFLRLPNEVADAKLLIGRLFVQQIKKHGVAAALRDVEFKVFSQFGDDGIIQYLIHQLDIAPACRSFVEFGVERYVESNTRFLLMNDNWRGLVMDSDTANIKRICSSDYYWKHDLTAAAAFVDRDNINHFLRHHGFEGRIGLLSIDIDGNDYWVWESIEAVEPIIVIVEYNAAFGPRRAVTIPYDARFQRDRAHYSNLYWGCSLKALHMLAQRKGYAFVGCNSAGNNAYFVRHDNLGTLRALNVEEGFMPSSFRESRSPDGQLTWLSGRARLAAIADMVVHDLEFGNDIAVGELLRE